VGKHDLLRIIHPYIAVVNFRLASFVGLCIFIVRTYPHTLITIKTAQIKCYPCIFTITFL